MELKYLLLSLSLLIIGTDGIQYANFTKTKLLGYNCYEGVIIKTGSVKKIMDCGRMCAETQECRKFLFCESDLICILFQDGTDCPIPLQSLHTCQCFMRDIGCDESGVCTCPWGQYGNNCENYITDCSDGFIKGFSSIYNLLSNIKPVTAPKPFEVTCRFANGGYTTIFDRKSFACQTIVENFNRSLSDYEEGFGDNPLMRWIGLKNMVHIFNHPHTKFELEVYIVKYGWSICWTYYDDFKIYGNKPYYSLKVGTFLNKSTCGNFLGGSVPLSGAPFSTYDVDYAGTNCGAMHGGGWWYTYISGKCARGVYTGEPALWYDDFDNSIGVERSTWTLRRIP